MNYLFATLGGNASRFLIDKLKAKYHVGDKPDAVFQPIFIPIIEPVHIDAKTIRWLRNILFTRRSDGFVTGEDDSLEDIFPRYLEYLQKDDSRTAVFNYAFEESLFSKFHVENVVFQIRHPCRPRRGLDWAVRQPLPLCRLDGCRGSRT